MCSFRRLPLAFGNNADEVGEYIGEDRKGEMREVREKSA